LYLFKKIENLRKENVDVGCSIAGGPTVITLTTADERDYVVEQLREELPDVDFIGCKVIGDEL
jgi:mevalonate pyrophosphate decarboxylase